MFQNMISSPDVTCTFINEDKHRGRIGSVEMEERDADRGDKNGKDDDVDEGEE